MAHGMATAAIKAFTNTKVVTRAAGMNLGNGGLFLWHGIVGVHAQAIGREDLSRVCRPEGGQVAFGRLSR